jgi:endonuclease I
MADSDSLPWPPLRPCESICLDELMNTHNRIAELRSENLEPAGHATKEVTIQLRQSVKYKCGHQYKQWFLEIRRGNLHINGYMYM